MNNSVLTYSEDRHGWVFSKCQMLFSNEEASKFFCYGKPIDCKFKKVGCVECGECGLIGGVK